MKTFRQRVSQTSRILEMLNDTGTARRITREFEATAGGCHAFRLRENRASSAPALSLRERAYAPSSRLNAVLNGLKN
jgi:hypothetical protein